MFKVGIRIDCKWQYYLVDGEAAVEKTVALAIMTPGFEKLSVASIGEVVNND